MTALDPPATPAEEAAAEAMWRIWSLGGASRVPSLWKAEGQMIRDIWRAYARVALASAPASVSAAVRGITDDYMTSEVHHPGYVLIPTARFDMLRQAEAFAVLAIEPAVDGYVTMPKHATREMVEAADACTDAYSAYNAMVEAGHACV
ncbi:hypothetical protein [Sphingomonas sp. Leaf4]|uniref:hypothetical protein n=1 Tax=Sphingomonas sp. Leaf4 TaxID=2876553 RepID=UPI001E5C95AE|nr:hypothetical protein [Sphingomonas sp. Leaf4]